MQGASGTTRDGADGCSQMLCGAGVSKSGQSAQYSVAAAGQMYAPSGSAPVPYAQGGLYSGGGQYAPAGSAQYTTQAK